MRKHKVKYKRIYRVKVYVKTLTIDKNLRLVHRWKLYSSCIFDTKGEAIRYLAPFCNVEWRKFSIQLIDVFY